MPTESSSRGFQKCPPTNFSALRSSGEGRRGRVCTSPCPHSLLCAGHPGSSSLLSSPTSHAGVTIPARASYAGDRHQGAHMAGPSWEWVQASFTLPPSNLPSAPESPESPRPFPSPGTKPRPFTWHSVPSWLRPQPAFSAVCLSVSLPWFNCQKLASTCRFPQAISRQLGHRLLLSTTPGTLGDPPPPGSCLPSPGAARRGFRRTFLEFP